ncbi:hypothetical protein Ahy_B08g093254 [Arachis hypogaea]|uniref:Uncharacterized protein n=1 Tax=Arachis hypogaea TaxID=3818 RepID=A0A444Y5Q6_ARAHY|nr:hypothetical protein Ahy_B08g093254 [Arachis hypogaea]
MQQESHKPQTFAPYNDSSYQIQLIHHQFPHQEAGLLEGCENFDMLPSLGNAANLLNATSIFFDTNDVRESIKDESEYFVVPGTSDKIEVTKPLALSPNNEKWNKFSEEKGTNTQLWTHQVKSSSLLPQQKCWWSKELYDTFPIPRYLQVYLLTVGPTEGSQPGSSSQPRVAPTTDAEEIPLTLQLLQPNRPPLLLMILTLFLVPSDVVVKPSLWVIL